MKKVLTALGVLAIVSMASAALPSQKAQAGSWNYVCCGAGCIFGDICSGNGTYTCCKAEE